MKRYLILFLLLLPCLAHGQEQYARSNPYVLGAGAVAESTPATIFGSSLKRWYRADSVVCTTPPCSDTETIETFTDKSGNSDAAYTSGTKSTYTVNAINGQVGATIGTADLIHSFTAYDPTTPGFSCFAVINFTNVSASRSILGGSTSGRPNWRINTDRQSNLLSQGTSDIATATTQMATTTYHKIAFTYSSVGAYAFYTNSDSTDGTGTNDVNFSNGTDYLFKGDGSEYFLGVFVELVIVEGVANATQISQMMGTTGYFNARYGL